MGIHFQDLPLYAGWGRPMRCECSVEGLEVVAGEVPADLQGSWYRAGPDRQYPPMLDEDVFIDGEGMAHLFRFDRGDVSYRSRWVRTERYIAQEQARRSLFGRYRNRYSDAPEAAGVHGGAANTHMIYHAGRLLVLKEDDLPYELHPDTLDTIARTDLGGQVRATRLSAHPKLDQQTGELLTYSCQALGDGSRDMAIYEIGADGHVNNEMWFQAPWSGVMHDFGVTKEHFILPFFPLITDMEVVKRGGTFYEWHDDKPVHVAVLPRGGKAEQIRWFRGPTASAGHMMNAFTEGSKIHLDVVLYEGNCFPFFQTPDGRVCESPPPLLTRMTMDLSGKDDTYTLRKLCARPGEMPRIDERFQGRPYTQGFMIMGRGPDGTSSVGRIDVTSGAVDYWDHGAKVTVQEPQFVPRNAAAGEGDGWLLAIINRLESGHSELGIFDAQHLAKGPVTRLHIPVRVRSTFHGSWVPEEALKK